MLGSAGPSPRAGLGRRHLMDGRAQRRCSRARGFLFPQKRPPGPRAQSPEPRADHVRRSQLQVRASGHAVPKTGTPLQGVGFGVVWLPPQPQTARAPHRKRPAGAEGLALPVLSPASHTGLGRRWPLPGWNPPGHPGLTSAAQTPLSRVGSTTPPSTRVLTACRVLGNHAAQYSWGDSGATVVL